MEACKPKALLGGENTLVSSWELGDGIEKCIISDITVSDTRSPLQIHYVTLLHELDQTTLSISPNQRFSPHL